MKIQPQCFPSAKVRLQTMCRYHLDGLQRGSGRRKRYFKCSSWQMAAKKKRESGSCAAAVHSTRTGKLVPDLHPRQPQVLWPNKEAGPDGRMAYYLQRLINALTLGSIYGSFGRPEIEKV